MSLTVLAKTSVIQIPQLRDDFLPTETYKKIWIWLDDVMEPRVACKTIVGILALANRADCEEILGNYLPNSRSGTKFLFCMSSNSYLIQERLKSLTFRYPVFPVGVQYIDSTLWAKGGDAVMTHPATLPLLPNSFTCQPWHRCGNPCSQSLMPTMEWCQYLAALCEQELNERYSRRIARFTKESRLPAGKTLVPLILIIPPI